MPRRRLNLGLPAYHGSPHDFEKFSLHKIGTGEGVQAYGWGLYFAGERAVAEYYRKSLTDAAVSVRGLDPEGYKYRAVVEYLRQAVRRLDVADRTPARVRARAVKEAEATERNARQQGADSMADVVRNTIEWLQQLRDEDVVLSRGTLFKVELPEIDELLDYDAPLSRQPATVQAAFRKMRVVPKFEYRVEQHRGKWYVVEYKNGQHTGGREVAADDKGGQRTARELESDARYRWANPTGAQLYAELAKQEGGAKGASEMLRQFGVPGLRYLDQASRGKDEGPTTHNYVIWDDARIDVRERLVGLGWMRVPGQRRSG